MTPNQLLVFYGLKWNPFTPDVPVEGLLSTRQQLLTMLKHVITQAGNANLMTDPLMQTLAEHAAGNHRLLMTMAGELLVEGLRRQQAQLDEKLYLEVFQVPANTSQDKRHTVTQRAMTR